MFLRKKLYLCIVLSRGQEVKVISLQAIEGRNDRNDPKVSWKEHEGRTICWGMCNKKKSRKKIQKTFGGLKNYYYLYNVKLSKAH